MTSREAVRQQLLGPEQMRQIGPREPGAEEARAVVLDRRWIIEEASVADVQPTARDPQLAVPRDPRREHAVEQVDAAVDRLEEVRRRAEPHQVSRPWVVGQERDRDVERRVALRRGLIAGQSADADAIERQRGDEARRCLAQRRVQPALDDAEQRLVRPTVGGERALRPAMRSRRRLGDDRARRARIDRLIEGDRDVRSERLLHGDRMLRRESVDGPVDVRPEGHAVLVDHAQIAERDDLEAARVREDRAVPVHEAMEPAEALDALVARPQV